MGLLSQTPEVARPELPTMVSGAEDSSSTARPDPLRRLTSTAHIANLRVMGRTLRLESNRLSVVRNALQFFARHQAPSTASRIPQFLWRIVCEDGPDTGRAGVQLSAFSDDGIRCANMEQRSFLAVDLEMREGIVFVNESIVEPEPRFNCRPIFDTLFYMSAGSLGLVSLSAACVGIGRKGILIFGPPNSGKTVTSYLAAKLGFEYHADHAVFLEAKGGKLWAWGDLLPAIFRHEALRYLPELRTTTRQFSYPGWTVQYLSKRPYQSLVAQPITPVCCVFLKRGDGFKPSVAVMERGKLADGLRGNIVYQDDDRFHVQSSKIVSCLAKLPVYELRFDDPTVAAGTLRTLIRS
jgi:hypothetical protein